MYCKKCGAELLQDQTMCLNCGTLVEEKQADYNIFKTGSNKRGLTEQNRMTVIILCAIFGGVGAHHFYMGEYGKGIIKVLLLPIGISTIWQLIDLVKLLTGKYVCSA